MYELTFKQLEEIVAKAKEAGVDPDSTVYLFDMNGERRYWTATGAEVDETANDDEGPLPLSVANELYGADDVEPAGMNLVLTYGD